MSARLVIDLDFDELGRWYLARWGSVPHKSLFPPIGFIVEGIAAGFLYLTDSSIAIIDGYISNPETDSKTRSDALNAITEALIGFAKNRGIMRLKCATQSEAIKKRAESHGFKCIGTYTTLILEI